MTLDPMIIKVEELSGENSTYNTSKAVGNKCQADLNVAKEIGAFEKRGHCRDGHLPDCVINGEIENYPSDFSAKENS